MFVLTLEQVYSWQGFGVFGFFLIQVGCFCFALFSPQEHSLCWMSKCQTLVKYWSHEISSKCFAWGQGICEWTTWEGPQQINKDFWGLLKVYRETEMWFLYVWTLWWFCLVARTLLTLTWTLLCLKTFPEPLRSLPVLVLKLPGAFLGPWLLTSQQLRGFHSLFFFFSLAGFCRWEQLVFAHWSAGGWPWWALANDYLIKICTKISLVPNTDFVRISFMFRSSFSAVIFKPFVTLWSVTPSPFSWSSAGSGHKLATV